MKKVWFNFILLMIFAGFIVAQYSFGQSQQIISEAWTSSKTISLDNNFNLKTTTLISSFKKNNYTIQIIKDPDGLTHKQILEFENQPRLRGNKQLRPYNPKTYILHESFEKYPGKDGSWMPDSWKQESKVGNLPEEENGLTWHISDGGILGPMPTDGKYEVYLNGADSHEGEIQDEWLISPIVKPGKNDFLIFDAAYSVFFMYLDLSPNSKGVNFEDGPFNTLQVLIRAEGEEKWSIIWDASKGRYNDKNISHYYDVDWNNIQLPLFDYQEKNIQFAFRLSGKNAQSSAIDNIYVGTPEPEISYILPEDFFFGGFNRNLKAVPGIMQGPAYTPVKWEYAQLNVSNPEWIMPERDSSDTYISKEESPVDIYPFDIFYFPILSAFVYDVPSAPYCWGTDLGANTPNKSIFFAGGNFSNNICALKDDIPEGMGIGTYNVMNNVINYEYHKGTNNYIFGTNSEYGIDGLINVFNKPTHPYLLNKVMINTAVLKAKKGDQLKLYITRNQETRTDTLAISTWRAKEDMDEKNHTLDFSEFIYIDPDGFEEKIKELMIYDEIAIELTGFYNTSMTLSVYAETLHDLHQNNHAFIYLVKDGRRVLFSSLDYLLGATSLCFTLDATFSFIGVADLDYTFEVSAKGGEKSWWIESWLSPKQWILSEIPDWLHYDISEYSETDKKVLFRLTADPLSEDSLSRSSLLTIKDNIGGECNFSITQYSSLAGITDLNDQINIAYYSDNIELSFPSSVFEYIELYSIMGIRMLNYNVINRNTININRNHLDKGVYIVKLAGNKTAIIKIRV